MSITDELVLTDCAQVKFYLSQLADRNTEVKDTACLCITELSQKVSWVRCCIFIARCRSFVHIPLTFVCS